MRGDRRQPETGERLNAVLAAARNRLFEGPARIWVTGFLVGLLAWQLVFGVPAGGIDVSWMGGLYMGLHDGKDFGTEFVFTYGPLGFLAWPGLWFSWLAVVALLFGTILYFAFAVTLTWTLERGVGLLGAALVTFLFLATTPDLEQVPLLLAVAWCVIALREDRPEFALTLLAAGGGSLAAVESLIKLSVGPLIFVLCLLGLAGARAGWRQWALFSACSAGGFLLLWLLAGQPLGSLDDYAENGIQIASGYNEAMSIDTAPAWEQVALIALAIGVVAAAARARFRDSRARWFAVALVALASFATYKYGIVRFEPNHAALALSALLGIWLLLPWPRRLAAVFLSASVLIGAVAVHSYPNEPRLDVVANLNALVDTAELVIRPGLRQQRIDESRANLQATYNLDPETLSLLEGRRVAVDPWEISAAWAYELDWHPLPVIQSYSAYTSDLDRLNAAAVADPDSGPDAILRANPGQPLPLGGSRSAEGRLPAWDPPEQNFATVCNFAPARTTASWQVLTRIPNRCGAPEPIGSRSADTGEAVAVPQADRGELILLRLHGVEIAGLERLRVLLWRPRVRTAVLNDGLVGYRLVPDTAATGLIVSRDPALDSRDGFEQLPEVENIRIEGVDGPFELDFYRVGTRPLRDGSGPR